MFDFVKKTKKKTIFHHKGQCDIETSSVSDLPLLVQQLILG